MKKNPLTFKPDAEAERFVDTADLSKYDLSGLKPLKMNAGMREDDPCQKH